MIAGSKSPLGVLCGCVAPLACRSTQARDSSEPFVARHHHDGNIAELLIPLLERSLARAASSETAEHRAKPGKKVIQVLPYRSEEHKNKGWRKHSRKKQVVEITPLHGKNKAKPLAYILSAAKPSRNTARDSTTSEEVSKELSSEEITATNFNLRSGPGASATVSDEDTQESARLSKTAEESDDASASVELRSGSSKTSELKDLSLIDEDKTTEFRSHKYDFTDDVTVERAVTDEDIAVTVEDKAGSSEPQYHHKHLSKKKSARRKIKPVTVEVSSELRDGTTSDWTSEVSSELTTELERGGKTSEVTVEWRDLTSEVTVEREGKTSEVTVESTELERGGKTSEVTVETTELERGGKTSEVTVESTELVRGGKTSEVTVESTELVRGGKTSEVTVETTELERGGKTSEVTVEATNEVTSELGREGKTSELLDDLTSEVTVEDREGETVEFTSEIVRDGKSSEITVEHDKTSEVTNEAIVESNELKEGFNDIVISHGHNVASAEKTINKLFNARARDIIQSSAEAAHHDCQNEPDTRNREHKSYRLSFLFNK